jgi:hypothetical protein
MSKVMIWPDIYREQGHWLPCVTLAKSLQNAGLTVRFMGIPDTQSIISPYASLTTYFTTILADIYPAGYSSENTLEPLDQRWKPAHILPIVGRPASPGVPAVPGELDTIFTGTGAPDLLVSGYFTALETLLIHWKYGTKFVIITTFLRHPADLPSLHAKTKLLYMQPALAQAIIDGVVPAAQKGMSIDDFVAPLDARPEIIPCSKQFDFTDPDWVHAANVSYVEPMILRSALDSTPPPPDPTESGAVAVPATQRLIFGTSGSQVQDYEFLARQLFLNLIAMMQTQGMSSYFLVLAVGDKLDAALRVQFGMDVNPSQGFPPNVAWFPWVSQLDIMKQADVVFMHGGLATIKESIWEQVPIVIIPLGKDQLDNALRVQRNGVGVVSQVQDLAPLDLRKLLTTATASTWVRQNLASMQGIFAAAENQSPKPSVTIINAAIAAP